MINLKIKHKAQGFTLIEMIVVVSIVAILAVITLFQFAAYRKGVNIETTAEEIALNLRRAQSMALAVRSTGGTILPIYQSGYGIHFELSPSLGNQSASDTSYILFTDFESVPGPGGWDRSYLANFNMGSLCGNPRQTVDECLERIELAPGDRITGLELCSGSGGSGSCTPLSPGQPLDITFLRPNLDAYFCTTPPSAGGCQGLFPTVGYAKITVTSPNGVVKSVSVWSTGQISIE